MSSDDPFVAAATGIGRRLTRDAVWDRGCCAWVGAAADARRPWRVEYRALGPTAYDGTAGVGLFLARLAAVTGAPEVRATAVGALRHALEHAPALPAAGRDGLQGGLIGIALAAVRADALLGVPELRDRACALVHGARLPPDPDRCPDVIGGSAGAIAGLLALRERLDEPALLESATRAGEALVDRATVTRHGWSWAIPGHRYPHHLCGFAHGAAGIGWALQALYAATGDPRFRDGADGAFAYLRSWRETGNGAWPDLRLPGQRRGRPHPGPSDATGTWCHGEAGIALALLGTDDAATALDTTSRHLTALMRAWAGRSLALPRRGRRGGRAAHRRTRRRGDGARAGGGRAVRGRSRPVAVRRPGRDAARPVPRAERDRLVAAAAVRRADPVPARDVGLTASRART